MSPVRTRSPAQPLSRCSSGVERFLGKEKVRSSTLRIGSYPSFKSFSMSLSTVFKYLDLFLSDTKGTDQNCFVLVNSEILHPNTKVYTPITSLNLTELT